MEIAEQLKSEAEFGEFILDEPEMFGVDELGDSAVVVKLGLKVRPDKQWSIKRELLRRIKQRFDELGIEIPYPQQTVYHRVEEGAPVPPFGDSVAFHSDQ
jgi:small conductance mechanosensitive channel